MKNWRGVCHGALSYVIADEAHIPVSITGTDLSCLISKLVGVTGAVLLPQATCSSRYAAARARRLPAKPFPRLGRDRCVDASNAP